MLCYFFIYLFLCQLVPTSLAISRRQAPLLLCTMGSEFSTESFPAANIYVSKSVHTAHSPRRQASGSLLNSMFTKCKNSRFFNQGTSGRKAIKKRVAECVLLVCSYLGDRNDTAQRKGRRKSGKVLDDTHPAVVF